jgi:hypothetical protein
MNQWTSGSMVESLIQWSNESLKQWTDDGMNQRISKWTHERMNEFAHGWMDGWASYCFYCSLLSYFFTKRPLRWGTPSLSNFFSEQPLTWATSALTCLPASSPIASATHFFSSSSRYNAFSTLQLRSRLPGASQHHWCFPARSRVNAFCHSRLQTGIAGAPHHVRAALTLGLNRTNLALPRECIFFAIFIWSRALLSLQSRSRFSDRIFQKFPNASVFDVFYVKPNSPYSLVQIFPTSSSKSAFDPFQVRLAAAAVLCIFCRRLSQIRGNRHPTSANNILKMYHRQTRRVVSRQYITNTRQ